MGTVVRRRHLWLSRGFLCHCVRCSQPQDPLRRIQCPECQPRERQQFSAACCSRVRMSGQSEQSMLQVTSRAGIGAGDKEKTLADWWNQSGIWVCRSCGWCSEQTGVLHRREAVLCASVFAFVMAQTVVAREAQTRVATREGDAVNDQRTGDLRGRQSHQHGSAVEDVLGASVPLLGRQHWATNCCLFLRLELNVALLLESSICSLQTRPPTLDIDVNRARSDLNGLWQWLELACLAFPPEYYLFDVVCTLTVKGLGVVQGDWEAAFSLLARLDVWASLFADKRPRLKLTNCHEEIRRHLQEKREKTFEQTASMTLLCRNK